MPVYKYFDTDCWAAKDLEDEKLPKSAGPFVSIKMFRVDDAIPEISSTHL